MTLTLSSCGTNPSGGEPAQSAASSAEKEPAPEKEDSDDDGLLDGYEMGEMCLSKYAFELGTFQ